MEIKKAVIPIAGFGTRFLPITKALPKAMFPIIDRPVIHYLIEEAVASGIEEIIIVTGRDNKLIKDYLGKSKELEEHLIKAQNEELLKLIQDISKLAKVSYVTQRQPLGLGHAIYSAKGFIKEGESFAVLLGDDLIYSEKQQCLAQLINVSEKTGGNIIGVQPVSDEEVSSYGIIEGQKKSATLIKVTDLVEKPDMGSAPSSLAIMGRYIIHSDIFEILEGTEPGKGGEIQLTDALKELTKNQDVYAYIFEGKRYDIGDKLGYLKATINFGLQQNELTESLKDYLKKL